MDAKPTVPISALTRRLFLAAAIPCCTLAHSASWTIMPEIMASETYTTNMTLGTVSPILQGWITEISPGINIAATGARARGVLSYRYNTMFYSGHSELNRHYNSLASSGTIEAIDEWLFFDASANIMQRQVSTFAPGAAPSSATANRTETRTVQLSPYIRGTVSDLAVYQGRLNSIVTDSDDPALAATYVNNLSGSLKNASGGAKIGWFADGNLAIVENVLIDKRYDAHFSAGLNLAPLQQLHLLIFTGIERTNYDAAAGTQTVRSPGAGIEWSPSQRTQFAALGQKRFFGTAHNVLASHRSSLSSWRYTDIRDVTNLPTLLAGAGQGTMTDLMSGLLTASIPDPEARARAIRERLNQSGVTSDQSSVASVQSARLTINRTREAAAALIRRRDTFTLSLTQIDQSAISGGTGISDNFSLSSAIRQKGGSLTWMHRLTPLSTLNLATARTTSVGLSAVNLRSSQISHTGSISHNLSAQASLSLGGRIIKFDSSITGVGHEYAVAAILTQRF